MIKYLFLILLGTSFASAAQDYSWWNDKHNWDGTTHWSNYLILSPAKMGPNALPVPDSEKGLLPENAEIELSGEAHFSEGDNTQNLFTRLYIPFKGANAGLSLSMAPIEHYQMDTLTRDIRRARDFDGKGYSVGDLYIGTLIQLVKDHTQWPDLMLSINLRTASGGNLAGARFTDTPGYFFNLSMGKSYEMTSNFSVRPHGNIGFYAWQTHREDYHQDDAFLYGLGCKLIWPSFEVNPSLDGYYGYIGHGDRPMVIRAELKSRMEGKVNYKLRLQHGLYNFPYTSIRMGCEVNFLSQN